MGVLAAVVYGRMALGMTLAPGRMIGWSRRHLKTDGAFPGPLVLLATLYLTSVPPWLCVVIGLGGTLAGAAMGA